jgi:hypothetical protein
MTISKIDFDADSEYARNLHRLQLEDAQEDYESLIGNQFSTGMTKSEIREAFERALNSI